MSLFSYIDFRGSQQAGRTLVTQSPGDRVNRLKATWNLISYLHALLFSSDKIIKSELSDVSLLLTSLSS